MRVISMILALTGLVLWPGCRLKETWAGDQEAVVVRYHFGGTARLATEADAKKFKEIAALPQSQALLEQTLQRLARSPRTLFGEQVTADQTERGAALLRPLLDDLIRQESSLEVRGPENRPWEWTLSVSLGPERMAAWRTNLVELVRLWRLGDVAQGAADGWAAAEVKRTAPPNRVRWVEAGSWLVLGVGEPALPGLDQAVRRVKTSGRPVAALTNAWLEIEGDLPRLAGPLGLPPKMPWPHAQMAVAARDENLRTTMRLLFSEPVTGELQPWRVPTRLITEPLISFTAARGIRPLAKRCETLSALKLDPPPNEFYLWAQAPVVFQSFVAFPTVDVTNRLQQIGHVAPTLLSAAWQQRGLAQIEWQATNTQVFWKGLPLITPFLKPAHDVGTEFMLGGLFPPAPGTNPPPAELLSQFLNRSNLICYDWEVTEARLIQWRIMGQLFAIIANNPQLGTNTAALPWLLNVESRLGNTVTELTAVSSKEWSFVRKSQLGFTGSELVALARWLESAQFPRLSLELPPEPRPERAGRPGAKP